ncbi:MAG: hypothetical protein EA368_13435 [Leptolyngbya sp. DLM2.Bin27]|nr:MAG: hypothetical protein EA368_13435 [Leptolyngbya sp. DLM2.Bin27]
MTILTSLLFKKLKKPSVVPKKFGLSLSKEHKMPEALGVVPRLSIRLGIGATLAIAMGCAS